MHSRQPSALAILVLLTTMLLPLSLPDARAAMPELPVVSVDDQTTSILLGDKASLYEDASGEQTAEELLSGRFQASFERSTKPVPSLGFKEAAVWVGFDIEHKGAHESNWLLEVAYPPLQRLDLYIKRPAGNMIHMRAGSLAPFSDRPVALRTHTFKVGIFPGERIRVLMRVGGNSSKTLPMTLWRADVMVEHVATQMYFLGAYLGIMLGLMAYNLFILITVREAAYLWYTAFLASMSVWTLALNGLASQWLWPDNGQAFSGAIPFLMASTLIFATLFTIAFVRIKELSPMIHRILLFAIAWYATMMLVAVFGSYRIAMIGAAVMGAPWSMLLIVTGAVSLRAGNPEARYYLSAWVALLASGGAMALKALGVLPSNLLTEYGLQVGSAVEAVLLSIALAARMRKMKEATEHAQKQVIDTVTHYTKRLENDVRERTTELIRTQQKLIATEKSAALGIFTAGMAHEINNPANFVSAGAQNTEAQLHRLQVFVNGLLDDDPDADIRKEFDQHFGRLKESVNIIRTGIQRIEGVVRHLQAMHPEGDAGFQTANIIQALEGAWHVVEGSLKVPVKVDLRLEARPMVNCMIADITQVFVALLTNAIHSIEDALAGGSDSAKSGMISLRSAIVGDTLLIDIGDNGCGIGEDIMERIFDPFFTTKTVGRGSGLGLSMARDVILKHGGTLQARSIPGEGSVFTVTLPLGASI